MCFTRDKQTLNSLSQWMMPDQASLYSLTNVAQDSRAVVQARDLEAYCPSKTSGGEYSGVCSASEGPESPYSCWTL